MRDAPGRAQLACRVRRRLERALSGTGLGPGWWSVLLAVGAVGLVGTLLLIPRDDPVGQIDAVVVLGGGAGERLELGRRVAVERGIPLVLSAEAIDLGADAGLGCDVEVVCLRPLPVNTAGEARASRALADVRGWDRLAVTTSSYHANRSRMLFEQCLGDRVDVVGARASGSPGVQVYRYARELLGRVAGATIRRAC